MWHGRQGEAVYKRMDGWQHGHSSVPGSGKLAGAGVVPEQVGSHVPKHELPCQQVTPLGEGKDSPTR